MRQRIGFGDATPLPANNNRQFAIIIELVPLQQLDQWLAMADLAA